MNTTFVWQSTHPMVFTKCLRECYLSFSLTQIVTKSQLGSSESVYDPVASASGVNYFRLQGSYVINPSHIQPGFFDLNFQTGAQGNCTFPF